MSNKKKEEQALVVDDFIVEFRKYTTELNKKFQDRKSWKPKDESLVLSYIPGTVTSIFVKEGQHIEEGEPLLILEAMKMKNKIFAENSGKLIKLHIAEGDQISKNKLMMELELD